LSKLACLTLPYHNYPFERALQGISKTGYKYVAFGTPHQQSACPNEHDDEAIETINRLMDQYNLKPVILFSHQHFGSDQPVERAVRQLHIARVLNIKEVNTLSFWSYHKFPDQPFSGEEYVRENQKYIAHLQQIAKEAERLKVMITLKPHTGNTMNGRVMKKTLTAIGSPYVKACYDPGNVSFYEGLDSKEDFQHIVTENVSFIAKDHKGGLRSQEFPIPGEGEMDFLGMFKMLKANGFNGPIVVEKLDSKSEKLDAEEIDRRILHARLNLERIITDAGLSLS
jgi:sugar phosphate isomerase/epimerase